MQTVELKKQISIFIPVTEWRALRAEAAKRGVPMTELCRKWLQPELSRLKGVPDLA